MVRSRLAGIAFVLGILVHWTPSARADVLDHYSFTGANGLSGNLRSTLVRGWIALAQISSEPAIN